MEKFSKFNDQRTGVNPFTVPAYAPSVGGLLVGAVLAALRLPVVLALGGALLAADALSDAVRGA
jgi:hypothetical protein